MILSSFDRLVCDNSINIYDRWLFTILHLHFQVNSAHCLIMSLLYKYGILINDTVEKVMEDNVFKGTRYFGAVNLYICVSFAYV